MKKLIVDCRINEEIKYNLETKGYTLIYTKPNKDILYPFNSHPDMLIRQLSSNDFICDRDNISYYRAFLKEYNLIPTLNNLKRNYPEDIALNYLVFKNLFIHKLSATDGNILNYYKNKGYTLIDVTQGYTKCNVAVGKNSLITSDRIIYEKLKKYVSILLIDHKQIKLKNFNYGFIGGASGFINGELVFTGSLKSHSSYEKIVKFLDINDEKYSFLSYNEIEDFGSIFEVY